MSQQTELLSFNRGVVSRLALARLDLKRLVMSAEQQTNWMPRIKTLNVARPDAVVSYKVHVMQQGLQPDNAFITIRKMLT